MPGGNEHHLRVALEVRPNRQGALTKTSTWPAKTNIKGRRSMYGSSWRWRPTRGNIEEEEGFRIRTHNLLPPSVWNWGWDRVCLVPPRYATKVVLYHGLFQSYAFEILIGWIVRRSASLFLPASLPLSVTTKRSSLDFPFAFSSWDNLILKRWLDFVVVPNRKGQFVLVLRI